MNEKLMLFCKSILDRTAANFPNEALHRLKANMHHLLNPENAPKPLLPMQNPTFHYYPGLRDQPWWDITFMPKNQLMECKEKIKAELQGILFQEKFTPFSLNVTEPSPPAYLDGSMNTYHLIRDLDPHQNKYAQRQLELPQTMALLRSIPGLADDAFFSCFVPGTHLKPHAAEDNVRLNVHLGLEVPRGCGIAVAAQQRIWPEDQMLCFDPSFTHEAWNFGASNRHVLLFTIWHPDLTQAEVFAIKLFSKEYHHYV